MNPMAELVRGRLTLQTPGDSPFTFATLKDLHTRALMLGIPTHATITHVEWLMRAEPSAPQQITVWWEVQTPQLPPRVAPAERPPFQSPAQQAPQVPQGPQNPYPGTDPQEN